MEEIIYKIDKEQFSVLYGRAKYIAEYNNNEYFCKRIDFNNVELFSKQRINESSIESSIPEYFSTKVKNDELTAFFHADWYTKYNGVFYRIIDVNSKTEKVVLQARPFEQLELDRQLGFEFSTYCEAFVKEIPSKDLEYYFYKEDMYDFLKDTEEKDKNYR